MRGQTLKYPRARGIGNRRSTAAASTRRSSTMAGVQSVMPLLLPLSTIAVKLLAELADELAFRP